MLELYVIITLLNVFEKIMILKGGITKKIKTQLNLFLDLDY
ncbi:MAG: hypothetical protein Athens101410_721 [Parcubacteria group bacterium Athens1014_10]|nr:MAG: hypothetical protein Athens101410_721 [Parcubacteria group bacterium Athens1014_10]TSD04475.1 MAG: hypothetical protein Athens071412_766 [Parcubacteria group bacterium Athens0714_12]